MRISDWSSDVCSSDLDVLRENARNVPLRAGDMLVLHGIWQDLAQTAASRDFVIVTDYPKGEQRPHTFKIAMAIFAVIMLIALSSKTPTTIAPRTRLAGMLGGAALTVGEAASAFTVQTAPIMDGR